MEPSDAYFAGFFDGEGYVGYYQRSRTPHRRRELSVQTVNKNREVLEAMQRRFGGSVYERKPANPSHAITFAHGVTGFRALAMLRALRPLLIVKAQRVDELLASIQVPPAPHGGTRTHCFRGHLFDEANTQVGRDGHRTCRTCERERGRRRRKVVA